MNDHERYAALLDAFIDGELSAQEAGEVREHLTLCADCRAYVSDALAMHNAFPDIEETIVPDGFTESVLAALPPRQIQWRTQWKKFALPLAACLAVFLLVRGLPKSVDITVPESVTSDMDAGGGTPMLSVAYNPDNAGTDDADYNADTMPPQASEAYGIPGATESAAASKKSAPEQRSGAGTVPAQEEAGQQAVTTEGAGQQAVTTEGSGQQTVTTEGALFDSVPLPDGNVETEEAFPEEDTASSDTEALPANENTAAAIVPESDGNAFGVPEPDGNAFGVPEPDGNGSRVSAPEEPEAELFSVSVSVWTVPVEAASLLEPYAHAGDTNSGVWYALTVAEFDALSLKLADSHMEAVSSNDTPPTTLSDAECYVFVPF